MAIVDRAKATTGAFEESKVGQLIRRYGEDRVALLAAAVAYNELFSMLPIMLAVLAIVGFFLRDPAALAQAESLIVGALPSQVSQSVVEVLHTTRQEAGLFGVISLVGLFWGGSGLFGTLEVALDQIYRTPERPFVFQKLMSAGMVLLFAAMVIVIVVASSVGRVIGQLVGVVPLVGPGLALAVALAGGATSLVAAFVLCLAILSVVPSVHLPVKHTLPGALVAALGLVLVTQLFPIYLGLAGSFSQYGAVFGLFFLLMTWAYLVAQVLLLGAEINAILDPTALSAGPAREPSATTAESERHTV